MDCLRDSELIEVLFFLLAHTAQPPHSIPLLSLSIYTMLNDGKKGNFMVREV